MEIEGAETKVDDKEVPNYEGKKARIQTAIDVLDDEEGESEKPENKSSSYEEEDGYGDSDDDAVGDVWRPERDSDGKSFSESDDE